MNKKNNNVPSSIKKKEISNSEKSTNPKTKKLDKVAVAIVVLAVILIGILGTQFILNPKATPKASKKAPTTAQNTTTQSNSQSSTSTTNNDAYPYFSNINNTFSTQFLAELNDYRSNEGLSNLTRVRSISSGSTVTLTIPNISTVAKDQSLDTEAKLASGVLHKFLETNANKEIANASVSTIYLNTEVTNGTLNLTVTVPYANAPKKSSTHSNHKKKIF